MDKKKKKELKGPPFPQEIFVTMAEDAECLLVWRDLDEIEEEEAARGVAIYRLKAVGSLKVTRSFLEKTS